MEEMGENLLLDSKSYLQCIFALNMLGFLLQQCFKHFKFSYNWVERLACLGKLDSLKHSDANKQVEMSTF